MKFTQIKVCFLVLIFGLIFGGACSTQEVKTSFNTAIVVDPNSQIPQKYKIKGSVSPINYNGEDLKQFMLSQPLPEIWLAPINNEADRTKPVSEESKKILYPYWLASLQYQYFTKVVDSSKEIDYEKLDVTRHQSYDDARRKLLDTPTGFNEESRKFSTEEVTQLLGFVRDSSYQLSKNVKESKEQFEEFR